MNNFAKSENVKEISDIQSYGVSTLLKIIISKLLRISIHKVEEKQTIKQNVFSKHDSTKLAHLIYSKYKKLFKIINYELTNIEIIGKLESLRKIILVIIYCELEPRKWCVSKSIGGKVYICKYIEGILPKIPITSDNWWSCYEDK